MITGKEHVMSADVAISEHRNVIKTESDNILKHKNLTTDIQSM
jgi:hypothetical protein